MKTYNKLFMAIAVLAFLTVSAKADPVTLTLNPSGGALTGPAGSLVGWGFTLDAGSAFAIVTGSDFCVGAVSSPCGNSFGTYTDFTQSQFIVAGPAPATETFSNAMQTGTGSFLINSGSTGTITGNIVMFFDLFSVDPNSTLFDPNTDLIREGDMALASASVTVGTSGSGGGGTPTPEPGSLLLVISGLAISVFVARAKR
jgi:hypothetical protein